MAHTHISQYRTSVGIIPEHRDILRKWAAEDSRTITATLGLLLEAEAQRRGDDIRVPLRGSAR